jgi:DeoR family fructose operon transcriptional repressor
MLAVKRHERIIGLLEKEQSVKVADLSILLSVTEKTIREDLEKLEIKGLLKRIHGGAVAVNSDNGGTFYSLQAPTTRAVNEKRQIAKQALKHILPSDIIALDSGSTTLEIAKMLGDFPVTVITNDLFIICELTPKEQVRIVVPGGYEHRNSLLSSPESLEFVRKLNIQKSFISSTGVHLEYGLTIFTSELVEQKKGWIAAAKENICVADHSKFDQCALITFAELKDIHCIITDQELPEAIERKYQDHKVRVEYLEKDE